MPRLTQWMTGLALSGLAWTASAQTLSTYPNKPVRLVVPFVGGPLEALARGLSSKLGSALGQPFVIDNQTGGGSVVAASADVVKSVADGHTLLLTGTGSHNLPPEEQAALPFQPLHDLQPVSQLVYAANIFVARPSLGVHSLAELVALAKARPGQLKIAIPAVRSVTHFAATLLQEDAAIRLTEVVYKGGTPAVNALLAGEADVMTASIGAVLAQIRAGQLVPLAVASDRRLSQLPQVPTAVESGYAQLVAVNVYGLFAPAGIPPDVLQRLNSAVAQALAAPDLSAQIEQLGMQVHGSSAADFDTYLRQQAAKWAPLARRVGRALSP